MRTFSRVAKLQKDTGVARPFPFVEMDCFVPSWAKCSGEMQWDVDDPTSALKKAPDMIKWMAAFDAFAIAMDVLKLMPYSVSMAHKRNCLWVAGRAASGEKKRRHHLCMYYDEVCRREWGVMAMRQDPDFSLDTTPLLHNADFLLHAQDAYDKENVPTTRAAPQNSAPASSKGGKGKGGGKGKSSDKGTKHKWDQQSWSSGSKWQKRLLLCNTFFVCISFALHCSQGIDSQPRATGRLRLCGAPVRCAALVVPSDCFLEFLCAQEQAVNAETQPGDEVQSEVDAFLVALHAAT